MPRWPVSLMTKLVAVVLAAIILAAACGGGTEANPEKLIPEGSNLIVKVNVAGLLTSDAVAAVVASLPEDEGDPQSLDQFLDQAISATGIDFRQVSRLVFFADFTPDDDFGALIAKGTFNEAAVLEVLERLQVIATSVYKGWRIHGPEGDTEGVALVFLEGDILVLGSVEAVKAVIDVQEGDRRRVSGAVPDALADLGHGLFSLAVEVPSEEIPDLLSDLGEIPFLGDNGQALSAILGPLQDLEILGLAVAENGQILNLRVNLDFADEDSAASVSKFLEGILTLASGLIPDAEARDLLDSLEVSADGSRLTIRLEVVASQIGSLVRARGEAQPEPPRVSLEAESLQTSIQSLMVDNGLTRVSVPTTATNEFSTLDLDPGPGVAYLSDYLRLPTTDLYFCWDDRGRVFGGQDTPGPCPVRALEPVEAPSSSGRLKRQKSCPPRTTWLRGRRWFTALPRPHRVTTGSPGPNAASTRMGCRTSSLRITWNMGTS